MHALKNQSPSDADHEARISRLRPRLVGYLLSLTASRSSAEDLAQETAIVLWDKRAEFDPAGNFPAWAFRIAFLKAQNYRRKEARRASLELPMDETFQHLGDATADFWGSPPEPRRQALVFCLSRMSERNRELLLQRYNDGESLEDLSRRQGTNRNALAQRMFRLKRSLLNCIQKRIVASR